LLDQIAQRFPQQSLRDEGDHVGGGVRRLVGQGVREARSSLTAPVWPGLVCGALDCPLDR